MSAFNPTSGAPCSTVGGDPGTPIGLLPPTARFESISGAPIAGTALSSGANYESFTTVFLVSIVAMLPALTLESVISYLTNTQRPVVTKTQSAWRVANPEESGVQNSTQDADRVATSALSDWREAEKLHEQIELPLLHTLIKTRNSATEEFNGADQLQTPPIFWVWDNLAHDFRPSLTSSEQNADPLRNITSGRFRNMLHDRRATRHSPWQIASAIELGKTEPWQVAIPMSLGWRSDFREAIRPPAGTSSGSTTEPPVDPDLCYTPPLGSEVHLVFGAAPGDTHLVFFCENHPTEPPATVVVPIRKVYFVLNNVNLKRVAGNITLPTLSLRLTLDADSWTWGFSATLPAGELDNVVPDSDGTPVELEASINGTAYRVLAEKLSRDRTFANANISISGRGKNAILDQPYAPHSNFGNTELRTSQQLMDDVLTLNGVGIGWDVDFGIDTWNVPEGVFSHQGSYISAINAIAAAAGAYVQPHDSAQTLRILSRYPTAPWDWGSVTPDFELPAAVTQREGIEWAEKARYNRVFITGTQQGVLAQVTRTGTAGDIVAPMITDALITEAVAGRQRGRVVLSDTGPQALVSLRLPVLAETGVIKPGKFVRYVDGATTRLGIVRSTSVDASGIPELWQTIGVETHV